MLRHAAEAADAKAKETFSAEAVEAAKAEQENVMRAEAQTKHEIEEVKLDTAARKALIDRAEGNLTYIENEAEASFRKIEEQAGERSRDNELRAERSKDDLRREVLSVAENTQKE